MTDQKVKITPESYTFKFGKYKNMRAVDVLKIKTIDKKDQEVNSGELYMRWLLTCEWFGNKDIISAVLGIPYETSKETTKPKPTPKKTYKKNATNEIMEEVCVTKSESQ